MLKRNESTWDRIIRAALGILLLWVGLWPLYGKAGAFWGIVVTLIALVLIGTAITGICLIYRLLGISTLKR